MTDFLSSKTIPCILDNATFITGKTYPVYNPSSPKEVIHEVNCLSSSEAVKMVDSASASFPSWKVTTIVQRREIFLKAASLLRERIPQYVGLTVQETCLPKGFSGFELAVLATAHLEECAASLGTALTSQILPDTGDGSRKMVYREPFGVVLGIAPWNAPFLLGLRSILYSIAAGNTAILKSSENSPRVHVLVAQVLIDAGLPKGVLSVAHVATEDAGEVVEAIISHKAVRKINFTGSTRVGRIIAEMAARHLKPTVMELGGKAPLIVLEDADLELTANHILFGGYINTNQVCMSVNNIFVHESIHHKLQSVIANMMKENQEIFTAKREENLQSPHALRGLFSEASAQRLKGLYEDAVNHGANIVVGQEGWNGAVVQPIILDGVNEKMRIFHEETFGPVLSMMTFSSIDEAVDRANDNTMGLAASVFGKDQERAFGVARRIQAGQVHVNAQSVHDHPMMAHGGWKESGWGRFNGIEGIREFTQTQGITVQQGHAMPFNFM